MGAIRLVSISRRKVGKPPMPSVPTWTNGSCRPEVVLRWLERRSRERTFSAAWCRRNAPMLAAACRMDALRGDITQQKS